MIERQQPRSARAARVSGTEPGPELEVSISDGWLTPVASYSYPWHSLPSQCGPGRSAEVSHLEGGGGCPRSGPEVKQGCSALTSVVCFLVDAILLSFKATCFSSPYSVLGPVACWSLKYCDALWLCRAGVCLSRQKWTSTNFCSRRNVRLSLSVLSLGYLFPNKIPSFHLFGDRHNS